jgi:VWFA-related protein
MKANELVLIAIGAACLLSPQAMAQRPPSFGARTTAIVVDVVVRDKNGHPVTDLRRDDFQLFDNDLQQQIGSVTMVAGPRTAAVPSVGGIGDHDPTGAGANGAATTPSFVALVFGRLSPEGRALARKGALAYLKANDDSDFTGVFLTDISLVTIQNYTNDPGRLKEAIDDVSSRATTSSERLRIGRASGDSDPSVSATASPESEGPGLQGLADPSRTHTIDPGATHAASLVAMTRRMERTFEAAEREQQGLTSTNSLFAIIEALGQLTGRKTIIFFAEGLAIPTNVQPRLQSLVAAANRLNVTIYSIDAAGLRVHSGQRETARRVNTTGAQVLARDPERPDGKLSETLEANEDALRRDPAVSLRLLAEPTGGFVVDNTNHLARRLREIDTDRRFHYLLTYVPTGNVSDGEWHTITVKVPSRPVQVRARSGYLAVRNPGTSPVLAYEAPALAALERTPPPTDLSIRCGAFVFPAEQGNTVAVLASLDAKGVSFVTGEASQSYRARFAIVARIRDENGETVRQASQPYHLRGPLGQIEQARRAGILFFRQPKDLGPGSYTLEVAVHDEESKRAGVSTGTFMVPALSGAAAAVSSLILVRHVEQVSATDRHEDNPLYAGQFLIYPNLGEPIVRAENAVTAFFTIHPGPSSLKATLEIVGAVDGVGGLVVVLDRPDATGRIHQVARFPTTSLKAGQYTLRLKVASGTTREVRDATFRLVD